MLTDALHIGYCRTYRCMSGNVRKPTFGHVRPVKIPVSPRIRAVWSETSLGAFQIVNDAKFLPADNEDYDQAAQTAQADLSLRFAHMSERYVFSHCCSYGGGLYKGMWAAQCENVSSGICGQRKPRSACASAQTDRDLNCSLLEWLNSTECMNGEQRPGGWYFAHAQDDLNLRILHARRHFFARRGPCSSAGLL